MLDVAIVFILVLWFVIIPTLIEIFTWFKDKSMSNFFKYSIYCKTCIMITAIIVSSIDISMGTNEYTTNKTWLRIYTLLALTLLVTWECYKHYTMNKYKKEELYTDTMILSVLIDKFFGAERGYNFYKREHRHDVTKNVWNYLKSNTDITDIHEEVLSQFKDYILEAERKALNTKDAKLLSAVIKAKLEYFDENNTVLKYYKAAVDEPSDMEERKIIHEIVTSNPRMFKML